MYIIMDISEYFEEVRLKNNRTSKIPRDQLNIYYDDK